MKLAIRIVLLAIVATTACPTLRAADDAGKAQELIDRAIKALGGGEALEKSRHRIVEEEGTYYGMGGQGLPYKGRFVFRYAKPLRYRMEILETFVFVTDGDKMWMSAAGTTSEIDGEALEVAQQGTLVGFAASLIPLSKPNKAFKLSLVEPETIDGDECEGITIAHEKMPTLTLHFSKKTGLVKRTSFLTKAEELDFKEVVEETVIHEYKVFGGLKYPARMTIFRDGSKYIASTPRKVTFPEILDEKEFARPQ